MLPRGAVSRSTTKLPFQRKTPNAVSRHLHHRPPKPTGLRQRWFLNSISSITLYLSKKIFLYELNTLSKEENNVCGSMSDQTQGRWEPNQIWISAMAGMLDGIFCTSLLRDCGTDQVYCAPHGGGYQGQGTSSSKSRGLGREGHVIEEFERPTVVDV